MAWNRKEQDADNRRRVRKDAIRRKQSFVESGFHFDNEHAGFLAAGISGREIVRH